MITALLSAAGVGVGALNYVCLTFQISGNSKKLLECVISFTVEINARSLRSITQHLCANMGLLSRDILHSHTHFLLRI